MKKGIIIAVVLLFALSVYKTYNVQKMDEQIQTQMQQAVDISEQELKSLQSRAKASDRMAQYELGLLYARGATNLPQDFSKAHELLKAAGLQGVPQAQYHLAEMYVRGDGVEENYEEATVWFWLATTLGDRYSQKRLRAMNTRISSEALANAKARVDKLWKQIPHDLKIEKKSIH